MIRKGEQTMRTREEEVIQTIYVAEDGKEFEDEESCMDYERICYRIAIQKECEKCNKKIGIPLETEAISKFIKSFFPFLEEGNIRFFKISSNDDLNLFYATYGKWALETKRNIRSSETISVPCTLCLCSQPYSVDILVMEECMNVISDVIKL